MLRISRSQDGTLLRLHTLPEARPLTKEAHAEIQNVLQFAAAARVSPIVIESDRGIVASALAPELATCGQ